MSLEEDFGLSISPEQMEKVKTVGDAEDLVINLVRESAEAFDQAQIVEQVRVRIAELSSHECDPKSLTRAMRLIEDLGWE